ncbi:hypothetical protein ACLKA6_009505 [Drosophila palustris]
MSISVHCDQKSTAVQRLERQHPQSLKISEGEAHKNISINYCNYCFHTNIAIKDKQTNLTELLLPKTCEDIIYICPTKCGTLRFVNKTLFNPKRNRGI